MSMTLKVTTTDETYEVTTTLFVMVQWERKFKRKGSEMATAMGYEDLAFMAFESCKVAGRTVPAVFDSYIKNIQDIEVVGEEDENPTQGEPTSDN